MKIFSALLVSALLLLAPVRPALAHEGCPFEKGVMEVVTFPFKVVIFIVTLPFKACEDLCKKICPKKGEESQSEKKSGC